MDTGTQARGDDRHPPTYDAQEVRQGEIILRSKRRRVVFNAGLVGFVLVALLFGIVA